MSEAQTSLASNNQTDLAAIDPALLAEDEQNAQQSGHQRDPNPAQGCLQPPSPDGFSHAVGASSQRRDRVVFAFAENARVLWFPGVLQPSNRQEMAPVPQELHQGRGDLSKRPHSPESDGEYCYLYVEYL